MQTMQEYFEALGFTEECGCTDYEVTYKNPDNQIYVTLDKYENLFTLATKKGLITSLCSWPNSDIREIIERNTQCQH